MVRGALPVAAGAKFGRQSSNVIDASINPSLAALISKPSLGLYVQKKYMLRELSMAVLAASIPIHDDGLTVAAKVFGTADYRERTFVIGYGKTFGVVTAGISTAYTNIKIAATKSSVLHNTISSIIKINEEITAGLTVTNPRFLAAKQNELKGIPTYTFGIGWQPSPITYFGFEALKESESSPSIQFLLQYLFSTQFMFSLGWSVTTNQPCVSFSWRPKQIRIETGTAYHPTLGTTPFANFIFNKQE